MQTGAIILPNQLFAASPLLSLALDVSLFEHPRFFSRYTCHKKKILLHRASMKAYEQRLRQRGLRVDYVEARQCANLASVLGRLRKGGIERLAIIDPVDHTLLTELEELCAAVRIELRILETPQFLTDKDTIARLFGSRKRYQMAGFYVQQRKRLGILLDQGKPVGGQWSFDRENRQRLPKDICIPEQSTPTTGKHVSEAKRYVEEYFGSNPGTIAGRFYPTTHEDAQTWLTDFIEHRLAWFGPYEDAISKNDAILFHSVLSPLLNVGLLNPDDVVSQVIEHARHHAVGIASLEGFVRQMIGWREFMRGVYSVIGDEQRAANFWGLGNPLPPSFYDGSTGIEPVDTVIKRVLQNAYAHHIERLMILGNFMLLCEIHPDEVYRWFMELFIDAYDWVMVPNVYGMSQYADGGRITTKPYISSSNYVRKMSDFPRGDWCDIWDGLFWRFINRHKRVFAASPRMRIMAVQLERMDRDKRKKHMETAERFLTKLFA
jgi:deoxyribodipyrimidine photolyase-related protein